MFYLYLSCTHFCELFIFQQNRRTLHVIQALNGKKCHAYLVSGKIKELTTKKGTKRKQAIEAPAESTMTLHISDSDIIRCVCSPDRAKDRLESMSLLPVQHTMLHTGEYVCCVCRHPCKDSVCGERMPSCCVFVHPC